MRFLSLQLSPRWKFLVALLLLTAITTYAFIRSEQIHDRLEHVWAVNNAKSTILLDMRVVVKGANKLLEAMSANSEKDKAEAKEMMARYQWLETSLSKNLEKSKLTSRNEMALMHKLAIDRAAAQQLILRFNDLLANNQIASASELLNKEFRPGPYSRWLADIDELISTTNESNAKAGEVAGADYERLRTTVLLLSALIVILGLVALWLTIKQSAEETPAN